ncbi:hypothetical protein PSN45_003839 [Yamadazyma tenuis]|uniref:Uncharacterized protein n=1 Tax=Candida tenuis (strain ATCC 10573 / BCRC 21748 / CBS 615 / JCM 9827 / NBRC 10315 / NRRL Y-1498 / VKM Y-70) TaxID=590646 RepID=G3B331_CANTC|nr:uncharacterized protein CANTEDRAFT_114098 [Yamadazyma tenuis ATCC 10573]XP_006686668.1 uncharacterized protein CANTEDRAFT_114098 [Yamadazyma tenuis ATCC 10573]EGV64353.1 hypothetical protein CANTEDRAFT_114098 [Yamadazyma tenuis ATCC 10573]EGV64354.1 hypothetical protein CANTEDRAFT_114098 [Yamadazyma tenuis ATCC 10573]WEJ96302.1 hypothetical protein PSN45_003839 [Yamadazyma tenuis]
MNSSDALMAISDHILNSINSLNKLEYNKNGRKYKFVNNVFQRIKQEDKHLIVNLNDLSMKASVISAYTILNSINDGRLLEEYPDFCLSIVGVARELETNSWFDTSNVVLYTPQVEFPQNTIRDSVNFAQRILPKHIDMGLNLLIASKINFFHTDHHLGIKIYGLYLIKFMKEYFGEDSINDADILVALKSFAHWGSIKCILYKLQVPNVDLTDDEFLSFKSFPDPLPELKQEIWKKYPSGTSRYGLLKMAFVHLKDHKYASLIKYPDDSRFDLEWLFELCKDIETNPIRYHLRSSFKSLTDDPVNLNELSQQNGDGVKNLLNLTSILTTLFELNFEFILKNSKVPKFETIEEPELISYYSELSSKIKFYEQKEWTTEDIIMRLSTGGGCSLQSKIEHSLEKWNLREL